MDLDDMLRVAAPPITAGDESVRREVAALAAAARHTATSRGQGRRWGTRVVLGVSAGALALGGAGAAAAATLGSIGAASSGQTAGVAVPNPDELVEVGPTADGEGTVYRSEQFIVVEYSEPDLVRVEIHDTEDFPGEDAGQ